MSVLIHKRRRPALFAIPLLIIVPISIWAWYGNSMTRNTPDRADVATKDGATSFMQASGIDASMSHSDSSTPVSLAPSLRGTDIDCTLELDDQGKLLATMRVRRCFDYFFSTLGEKTEAQIIVDIRRHLESTLPPSARPYALELLSKYIQYRQSEVPAALNLDDKSPESMRLALESLRALRLRYFTRDEAQAFFGDDEAYDRYNIEASAIRRDASLSQQQKEERIAALSTQLPRSLAENMSASQQYNVLESKTEEIRARGGSPQEVHALRESLVGAEAAGRLAALDAESDQWRQRVSQYLDLRAQILAKGGAVAEQQQAITKLRNATFSAPEDRIRAQTYESMRDQGDNRIF